MANATIGIISPVIKGAWDETASYNRLNIVSGEDGATYQAIQDVPVGIPLTSTAYWMQITPKAIVIGNVTSVAADEDPTISNSGTVMAPVWDIEVPRGVTGNESIDDSKGIGDTDYVWSADKAWKSTINLTAEKLGIMKVTDSIFSLQNKWWNHSYPQGDTSGRGPGITSAAVPCPVQGTKIRFLCDFEITIHPEYFSKTYIRLIEWNHADSETRLYQKDYEVVSGQVIEHTVNNAATDQVTFSLILKISGSIPATYTEKVHVNFFHAFEETKLNTNYVKIIDDTAGDGDDDVVWSADKINSELSEITMKVEKNDMADVDELKFTGTSTGSSTAGKKIADNIDVAPGTDIFVTFSSLTATGTPTALIVRISEYNSLNTVLHRHDYSSAGTYTFRTDEDVSHITMWVIYKADTGMDYTLTGFKLRKNDMAHDYYLPSSHVLIGDEDRTVPLSMFRRIGFCGDSFTAGSTYADDEHWVGWIEELTWGKVLCREIGAEGSIFAISGLTTETWLTDSHGLPALKAADPQELYFIALGINDYNKIKNGQYSLGTSEDIHENYEDNPNTFYGNYGKILAQIKAYAPKAKIICVGYIHAPFAGDAVISPAVEEIAGIFGVGYIYPKADRYFQSSDWGNRHVGGHPVAPGYAGMARAIRRLAERHIYEAYDYYKDYTGDFVQEE